MKSLPAVACFYTAIYRRLRGATWPSFAPALIYELGPRQILCEQLIFLQYEGMGNTRQVGYPSDVSNEEWFL
jgi:hypothetical protein